jgi:hypothetical protein
MTFGLAAGVGCADVALSFRKWLPTKVWLRHQCFKRSVPFQRLGRAA